jgi:CBS domain containing-hemolysin-like protein
MRNNLYPRSRRFPRSGALRPSFLLALTALTLAPARAHASLLQGEALDTMANIISWVAIIVAPIVLIGVFWMVHIIPEKVAEKKKHPQAKAIQVLCLLSLFFGGLLWPLAWLWAYSKPVLHRLAYGTDVDESHGAHPTAADDKKGGQS